MKRIPYIIAALFLLLGSQLALAYDGSGTAADPYLIITASDWNQLYKDSMNGKTFSGQFIKLVADISVEDLKSTNNMLGDSPSYPFRGTFDGNGYKLTFTSLDDPSHQGSGGAESYIAPFRYVGDGAVIKNLRVEGHVQTYQRYLAGLVACAEGNVTIRNCWVSVNVDTTGPREPIAYNGGMIAHTKSGSTVTMVNCRFDGQMNGGEFADYSGGLVGQAEGTLILTNCLFNPSSVNITETHCATLARMSDPSKLTINNSYFVHTLGTQQGTDARTWSGADLESALGAQWYITGSQQVVPILLDIEQFAGDGTSGNPYKIASRENWNLLVHKMANQVSYVDKFLQLTADITIDKMAGLYVDGGSAGDQRPFSGTFDGGGHTLTLNLIGIGNYLAPFACLKGATIKNLVLAGSVKTNNIRPAGLAAFVMENSTIQNCKSSVSISSTYDVENVVGAGAYVAHVNQGQSLTIMGCSFTGIIDYCTWKWGLPLATKGYGGGGFVGYAQSGSNVTLKNCFFEQTGTGFTSFIIRGGGEEYDKKFRIFVGGKSDAVVTLTNCYYFLSDYFTEFHVKTGDLTVQGTQSFTIGGKDGVTVAMDGTATAYNVSAITSYGDGGSTIYPGLVYNAKIRAGAGELVKLLLSKGEVVGSYTPNHGTLEGTEFSGTDDHHTLTMAGFDTDISYNGLLYLRDSDDSADIITQENGHVHIVVLGRTLQGGKWNSFSAPFDVVEAMVKSVFGDTVIVNELTGSSYDNGTLSLTYSTVTSIVAGKAYLIKPAANVVEPRFENVTINKSTTPTETAVADFKAAINPVSFTARDKSILFFTPEGSLAFPSGTEPMKGFRAYIKLKGAAAGQQ